MNPKLDEYSLKCLESIFNASQDNALRYAAQVRRIVIKEKMKWLKEDALSHPEEISEVLSEMEKLSHILGPDEEVMISPIAKP